ncbi:MAG: PDZ domain-containing protein, partial [Glaciecola sp.]
SIDICLPSWIPGSYMVRDFTRNLHGLRFLPDQDTSYIITQLDKQTWRISTQNGKTIESLSVQYQIYAYDLSVRSAFINDEYAFFNGTSTFLYISGQQHLPHYVTLDDKSFDQHFCNNANSTITAMPQTDAGHYVCADYYELIDHPFLIGCVEQLSFAVKGTDFHLVFTGQNNIDLARIARDLKPIIEHHISLFGSIPCKAYWFMTLVCEGGFGGLEHIASTVLQYSRFDLPLLNDSDTMSDGYQRFLSLCSHELFHTWHVKQIKPAVMHQPDLSAEVYSKQLWIYEGFTSLYDDLSLARSGIISPEKYVQVLNEVFTRLLKNNGRHKQSVASSSFEAWSKFYKQDAGSVNHIVSYYNKGTVVALCLDIMVRQQSNNAHSLDDIMRLLWEQYGKPQIGTKDDVIQTLCKSDLHINLDTFIHMATETSMDLPFASLLQSIGLDMQIRGSTSINDKGGLSEPARQFDVGAAFTINNFMIKINAVYDGRSASQAGLMVNDTIVAVDRKQCDEARLYRILNQYKEGDTVLLHVLRDGRLIDIMFPIMPNASDTCSITIIDAERFKDWLGV